MKPIYIVLLMTALSLPCQLRGEELHLHKEAYQLPNVATGPSPQRVVFPTKVSRTTLLYAFRFLVEKENKAELTQAYQAIRQHAPNLLWDLKLQAAVITALSKKGNKDKQQALSMLKERGLSHLVHGHLPVTTMGDLNARFGVTSSGATIPIRDPAPGSGPGMSNQRAIPGDELREHFSALFIKADLHKRIHLEIKEARHFVNNHVRYSKDRTCCVRQRHVQKAIENLLLARGRLPRGGYKNLRRALIKGNFISKDKYFRCVSGRYFDYDKRAAHKAISCSRHGWYGDWQRGPSPYNREHASRIFRSNSVVWSFLREYSCKIRRRALRQRILHRLKDPVTFKAALAVADELEHQSNSSTISCPLDGQNFEISSTSLNNRNVQPFAVQCPNHSVIIETDPAEESWPAIDKTKEQSKDSDVPREPVYNSLGMKMVWIPPGRVLLGSPMGEKGRSVFENPQTEVTLSRGFWMSETEVTQKQYQKLIGKNPSTHPKPHHPVSSVSFVRALIFCKALTEREKKAGTLPEGYVYTLPSEAQWEYACRANTTTPFWTGKTITSLQGNFDGRVPYANSLAGVFRKGTTPVKTFPPNPLELYDMIGNVAEWCLDNWEGSYIGLPRNGEARKSKARRRVIRGGSWRVTPEECRSAARRGLDGSDGSFSCGDVGIRLVIQKAQ